MLHSYIIIKEHGIKLYQQIYKKLREYFEIINCQCYIVDKNIWYKFYEHVPKKYIDRAVDKMGEIIIFCLLIPYNIDKLKEIVGTTDPKDSPQGTIRSLSPSLEEGNLVHCSDDIKTQFKEISYIRSFVGTRVIPCERLCKNNLYCNGCFRKNAESINDLLKMEENKNVVNKNKNLGKGVEYRVSKKVGGRRRPLSGALDFCKGDVINDEYLYEVKIRGTKNKKGKYIDLSKEWIDKIKEEAEHINKKWGLVFKFKFDKDYWIIKDCEPNDNFDIKGKKNIRLYKSDLPCKIKFDDNYYCIEKL